MDTQMRAESKSQPSDVSTMELRYQVKRGMTNEMLGSINSDADKAILQRVNTGEISIEEARGLLQQKVKETRDGKQGVPL